MPQDWKKVLITPDATIQEAIETIDREGLRIVLVVDNQGKLLGTITDGDVRRALIKHKSLESPVSEIMNASPKSAEIHESKARLIQLMEQGNLLHMPLLKDGVVVGLETLQHLMVAPRYDNPVFLMAGGFGTRLKPLTDNCPKPLLKVGGKPILETILESFIEYGFHRFYISTHFMPEMIRDYFGDGAKWGVSIEYIHESSPLGTGGALGLLPKDLPNLPLIMMNGDVLTKVDFEKLLAYHVDHDAIATMCVREYSYQVPYGVIKSEGHKIVSMVEKPSYKFFVNAGIYVLDPAVVQKVTVDQCIDMPTLLEQQIGENAFVSMFPLHEYWLDIGKMNDFEKAQIDFLRDFT